MQKDYDWSCLPEKELEESQQQARDYEKVQNNPHLIYYDNVFKNSDGNMCVVMPFIDGGDLNERIEAQRAEGQKFEKQQILKWFIQTCLGLKHLHAGGLVHRNVKSSNIFLTHESNVKLGDFGFTHALKYLLTEESMEGSPQYMAPEILNDRPFSDKADVWSLGVVLYELCALELPYAQTDFTKLCDAIAENKKKELPADVAQELRELVDQLMQVDPDKRPNVNEILNIPFVKEHIDECHYAHEVYQNRKDEEGNEHKVFGKALAKHDWEMLQNYFPPTIHDQHMQEYVEKLRKKGQVINDDDVICIAANFKPFRMTRAQFESEYPYLPYDGESDYAIDPYDE